MAVSTVYDETVAPGGSDRSNYSAGLAFRFAVSQAQYLRSVSIYQDSGSLNPTGVELIRTSDSVRLWHSEAPVWTGSRPGWRTWVFTLTQAQAVPLLAANTAYSLQVNIAAVGCHFREGCDVPVQPDPWSYEGAFFGDYGTLQTGSSGTGRWGLSAGVDAALPGGGGGLPATSGTVGENLAAWMSTDSTVNDHQADGLPARTDANVTTVKGEAEGVNGFAAIKAVADAIASAVAGLPGTIANAVTTITGQITSSTADIFSHAVTGLTAISGDVRSVENHALDVLAGMVTFPGASPHYTWTAGDPIGFDQCVAVAVPAEAYHLEILDHPRHPLNQVCGVNIIYRSGWWCELSGEIGAERHYIDFEKTLLRAGSHRLSGCLVSLEPGFSGVLTPYTLEPV